MSLAIRERAMNTIKSSGPKLECLRDQAHNMRQASGMWDTKKWWWFWRTKARPWEEIHCYFPAERPWRNESPNTVRSSLRSGIQILVLAANSLKIAVAWNQANHGSCHRERTTAWRKCQCTYVSHWLALVISSEESWVITVSDSERRY